MTLTRKALAGAGFAGALLLAAPSAAFANYGTPDGYGGGDGVTVSDPTPTAGQTLTVTVGGWQPLSSVTLSMGGLSLGTFQANAQGVVTATFTLPAGVTGSQTLVFSGVDGSGSPRTVSQALTIAATNAGGGGGAGAGGAGGGAGGFLPRTGSEAMSLFTVGGMLVVVGGAAAVATRKRLADAAR